MRKIHLILCLVLGFSLINGCKKGGDSSESLKGTWELTEQYGGFKPPKKAAPGSGNLYMFSKNKYRKYENGVLIKSGTYQLKEDSIAVSDPIVRPLLYQIFNIVYFDNNTNKSTVKTDSETIIEGYRTSLFDGTEYVYKKISGNPGF